MADIPYMPLWVHDLQTDEDCALMSLAEYGAYIKLLERQWIEGSIPADPARLARLLRVTASEMESIWKALAPKFVQDGRGRLKNRRCDFERDTALRKVEANRKNGAKGGRPRKTERLTQEKPNGLIRASGSVSDSDSFLNLIVNRELSCAERRFVDLMLRAIGDIDHSFCQDATPFHREVERLMSLNGFEFRRECEVALNDGRKGRIDLLAAIGGVVAAIELDRCRPRTKSVSKLVKHSGLKIIVLREGVMDVSGFTSIDVIIQCRPSNGAIGSPRSEQPGFASWWASWPRHERKVGKTKCRKAWASRGLEASATAILAALERSKASADWKREGGRFIPQPERWLNQTPWETDDSEIAKPKPSAEQASRRKLELLEREGQGVLASLGRAKTDDAYKSAPRDAKAFLRKVNGTDDPALCAICESIKTELESQ